jgi:hypothetical protein
VGDKIPELWNIHGVILKKDIKHGAAKWITLKFREDHMSFYAIQMAVTNIL